MRKKDTSDVLISVMAVVADAVAVFAGFMLAAWIRFHAGWIALRYAPPDQPYLLYSLGSCFATLVFLLVFRSQGLFVRPQTGSFINKIPRLMKGTLVGVMLSAVLAFAVQNQYDFSRVVVGLSLFTIGFFVLLERYILFRIEWNLARHSHETNRVLILGTDTVAAHVARTVKREPMLRSRVIGFLRTDLAEPNPEIPRELIHGTVEELFSYVADNQVDQIILTSAELGHKRIVEIIILCERNLITFNMVPDLFRIMTNAMDVQSLDDIPLLGISRWPLDLFWNRALKRMEDITGALVGLLVTAPVMAVSALLIRKTSPGPVFYAQERCGEDGKIFVIYKLRTMRVDAEVETGPVFTEENDSRKTRVGAFLRRYNLDELPQLWNVLRGEMSLVGPRPERPHFVEQFKEDVGHYMWRHVSKPGVTGWAQVNGLRGNTSIQERVKYDLYYLENWSLAFDFKILVKTLFARENAY